MLAEYPHERAGETAIEPGPGRFAGPVQHHFQAERRKNRDAEGNPPPCEKQPSDNHQPVAPTIPRAGKPGSHCQIQGRYTPRDRHVDDP